MSGLYTRFNLSEQGLNGTDAVQKLYLPSIQDDINLFASASKLESSINSPDQITGFVNEPFSNISGDVFLRTKFTTNQFTFSDGNIVWFDSAPGIPVKSPVNGSIVELRVKGTGSGYRVTNSIGIEASYPYQVNVQVLGRTSGSRNAIARVTVNSNGKISSQAQVIFSGSGYVIDETLELLPACTADEDPILNKCANYGTGFSLKDSPTGHLATLSPVEYKYTVRSSSRDGFFLYDEKALEWVYLGEEYDEFVPATQQIVLKRQDSFTSDNLSNLFQLNGRSLLFSYNSSLRGGAYTASETLGEDLQDISDRIESIRSDFSDYIQNCRVFRSELDEDNELGSRYNIISGFNFTSNYRTIFRDPDKVLETVEFNDLRLMIDSDDTQIGDKNIPGIWIFNGDRYQRVFSNDNKPFVSLLGKFYLSPRLYGLNVENEAVEATTFKYSINTSYFNQVSETTLGFDVTLSTLVQNISQDPENGGFVFYRPVVPITLNASSGIESWPLFSYKDGEGNTKDSGFLGIIDLDL
jgi:hypothetical protein